MPRFVRPTRQEFPALPVRMGYFLRDEQVAGTLVVFRQSRRVGEEPGPPLQSESAPDPRVGVLRSPRQEIAEPLVVRVHRYRSVAVGVKNVDIVFIFGK